MLTRRLRYNRAWQHFLAQLLVWVRAKCGLLRVAVVLARVCPRQPESRPLQPLEPLGRALLLDVSDKIYSKAQVTHVSCSQPRFHQDLSRSTSQSLL